MKMKKIYFILPLLAGILSVSGCTGKFEEYNRPPYQPTEFPDNDLLVKMFNVYASPQQNDCQFNNCMWACYSGQITAPYDWGRGTAIFAYFNAEEGWNQVTTNNFYSKIYPNFFELKEKKGAEGLIYSIALLTRVYAMQEIATLQGPLPYTTVKKGDIYVKYDSEQAAWTAMFEDLDFVIYNLKKAAPSGTNADLQQVDCIYRGNCAKWLKFANTLKLRMAIRLSGVAPEFAKLKAEEAVADGVMTSTDDSAYDTTNSGQTNNGYKIVDGWGELKANACLVSYMNGYQDPRRSAYFTEAAEDLGGGYIGVRSGTTNPPVPNTYKGYSTFKIAVEANPGLINAGANPMPIMYASEAAFLRAEGAVRGWNMNGTAKALYEEGIRLSFEEFGVRGADDYMRNSTLTPGDHNDPVVQADSYENQSNITIAWEEGATMAEKLERIITQKWIASLLNPMEGWADFRRTGYPRIFPPVVSASQQGCGLQRQMRRLHFPKSEYDTNAENTKEAAKHLSNGIDSDNTDLWWALKSNGQY